MPALLSRPLAASHIVPAAFALALAVAAYCLAYSWFGGQPERLEEALAWSAVNVVPWFLAFEAAKRMRNAGGRIGALAAGLARHGFVRIHRSHLVRRDAIVRIRTADVILRDGTSLKIGKRFRTRLRD